MTRRRRRLMRDRQTVALDPFDRGHVRPLGVLLGELPRDAERVLLVGPRTHDHVGELRRWAVEPVDGWTAGSHHVPGLGAPLLRYVADDGRRVELLAARAWLGSTAEASSCVEVLDAWQQLGSIVRRSFGLPYLLATPAATGRDCLANVLPEGGAWPVLDAHLAELIRATTGQGRWETFPRQGDEVGELVELDQRFAYGALARLVPVGDVEHAAGEPADPYVMGRSLATWQAPASWDRAGILPERSPDGAGWRWPRSGSGWVDRAELHLARQHGWHVEVAESITWTGAGPQPLRRWAELIHAARASSTSPMVEAALRKLLIDTVGALVGRPHRETVSVPVSDAASIPDDALSIRQEGDRFVYQATKPDGSPWRRPWEHPEWAASIWARCRVRLLEAPTGEPLRRAGLLHLPAGVEAVAASGDALVLTGDPDWPDDLKPGRLRVKGSTPGPLPWPRNRAHLYRLTKGDRP